MSPSPAGKGFGEVAMPSEEIFFDFKMTDFGEIWVV